MPAPVEGYVFHTYGPERYVRHAVASVISLRRHDVERPVALYCPPSHRAALERDGLDTLFAVIEELPEAHRSIVGFKHHLHRFLPFERSLYVDADMIWCRNPDPLWTQLAAYAFTATGIERADFFFGGPKGPGVLIDFFLNRRKRTMRRFGLTHLPRVQAGMIYVQDATLAEEVCTLAAGYLQRRDETHFRSRLNEGRTEESCEWSMAMAMSKLHLQVYPWMMGYNSPQLDYVDTLTTHDPDFEHVTCKFYCDPWIYSIRSFPNPRLRTWALRFFAALQRRPDYLNVTPFVLHFGSLHQKQPFYDFSERTWAHLTQARSQPQPLPVE